MLEFIKLSTMKEERQMLLKVAIEDLKDSIQAHQSYKSLTSREQFYILVLASFKLSLALLELQSKSDQEVGRSLKAIAVKLYEHYCSSSGHVVVDDRVVELIDKCLDLLGLERYHSDNLTDAGQVLLRYYKRRAAQRLKENTRLRVERLFANNQQMPLSPGSPETLKFYESGFMSSPGTQHSPTSDIKKLPVTVPERLPGETVDRCAVTVEDEDVSAKDRDKPENVMTSVDRCALTVDEKEEFKPRSSDDTGRPKKGVTVDRCALTVEETEVVRSMIVNQRARTMEEEELESRSGEDIGRPEKVATVDRSALTVEGKETESGMTVDQRGEDISRLEMVATVDRSALTVEETEYERVIVVDQSVLAVGEDKFGYRTVEDTGTKDRVTVGQCALTMEEEEKEANFKTDMTFGRHAKTVDSRYLKVVTGGDTDGGVSLDQCALSVEGEQEKAVHSDQPALAGIEKTELESRIGEDAITSESSVIVNRCALVTGQDEIHLEERCRTDQDVTRTENRVMVDRYALQVEGQNNESTEKDKPTLVEVMGEERNDISENVDIDIDQSALVMNYKGEEEVNSLVDSVYIARGVKTVNRCGTTAENEKNNNASRTEINPSPEGCNESIAFPNGDQKPKSITHGKTLDQHTFTEEEDQRKSKTVDDYAFLMSRSVENDSGIIIQSLEDEAVSLPSQSQPKLPLHLGEHNHQTYKDKSKRTRGNVLH